LGSLIQHDDNALAATVLGSCYPKRTLTTIEDFLGHSKNSISHVVFLGTTSAAL
jgi:hypothetical protein